MKGSMPYILYYIMCMAVLIIAITFFWWFTAIPYTMEPFITPNAYIIMVGLTNTGQVYYADIDVPMSPKWILSTAFTGVTKRTLSRP